MLTPAQWKQLLGSDRHHTALLTASFLMSIGGGVFLVAVPFVIKRLGGTDAEVGVCMAQYFAAYMAGCLAGGMMMDKLNAQRAVQYGSAGIALMFAAMCATVVYASHLSRPIWLMDALGVLAGMLTALFWPPLMGWISTGHEGEELNRRLGKFNVSWSLGGGVSPYIGGVLVGLNSAAPLLIAAAATLAGFIAVRFARDPLSDAAIAASETHGSAPLELDPSLRKFRWMARVALLTSFTCIGLLRSQLGILFKFELGLSEADYGMAIAMMCLANFLIFWLAGRTHAWHYRLWLFVVVQIAMAASMAAILAWQSLWILCGAVALAGGAEAFLYTSHLFYGVAGKRRRSARMALHEFLLSVGLVGGSVVGGYLSDEFGRYMPYWFGSAAVVAGILPQLAIWRWFAK